MKPEWPRLPVVPSAKLNPKVALQVPRSAPLRSWNGICSHLIHKCVNTLNETPNNSLPSSTKNIFFAASGLSLTNNSVALYITLSKAWSTPVTELYLAIACRVLVFARKSSIVAYRFTDPSVLGETSPALAWEKLVTIFCLVVYHEGTFQNPRLHSLRCPLISWCCSGSMGREPGKSTIPRIISA